MRDRIEESIESLRLRAEQGNADAQYELGFTYWGGEGVPEDQEKALWLYRLEIEQGEPNPQEAARWYRAAADQGNHPAKVNLASMHHAGLAKTQDNKELVWWYRAAAARGKTYAQHQLGV